MSDVWISKDIGAGLAGLPRFDARSRDIVVKDMIKFMPEIRDDASATFAFARQLEYIYKEIYEVEFPELRATEFIPLSTEVPPGALTHTYRMWNVLGHAKIVHDYAMDLPNADVEAVEWPAPIVTVGASYNFSVVDIQRAAMANAPIETMKARAARLSIERLFEQIAAVGSANEGVIGLTNAPGVNATAQVSTGGTWLAQIASVGAATAAAPAAAVAAVQGIAADLTAMINKIFTQTVGVHMPDTCLLTPDLYIALKTLPRSPAFTNDSCLDYLEKLTGLKIDYWPALIGSGAIGTAKSRIMVYKKDPDVLKLVIAQPYTQLPPQAANLSWKVPCLGQTGGVVVMRPMAVTYMDGLSG